MGRALTAEDIYDEIIKLQDRIKRLEQGSQEALKAFAVPEVIGLRAAVFELTFASAVVGVTANNAAMPFAWPNTHDYVTASISNLNVVNNAYVNQVRVANLSTITYAFTNPTSVQTIKLTIVSFGT